MSYRLDVPREASRVMDDYENLFKAVQRNALVEALREGERDLTAGRVLTHDEMRARWLSEDPEAG